MFSLEITMSIEHKIASTNFKSSQPIEKICDDLEKAFETTSIKVIGNAKDSLVGFDCSSIRLGGLCEFKVNIHKENDMTEHIIEVSHLYGCRYAFRETFSDLINEMGITLPNFKRTMYKPPVTDIMIEQDPQTCSIIFSMLGDKIPMQMKTQMVRSAGTIVMNENLQYTTYYETGGVGMCIANRLLELACDKYYIEYNDSNLSELLYAIANICESPNTCIEWLKRVIPICESYIGTEFHANVEAKRALKAIHLRNL